MAGIIAEDPGNLSRELVSLEREGLFNSSKKGSLKIFSLNKSYPLFRELKDMIFKTEGVEGSLREIVNNFRGIEMAFIYGSYATSREKEASDIDVFVVGDIVENKWIEELNKLEGKLNREINYVYYDPVEFKQKIKKAGGFLSSVIKGKVIMLKGKLNA
jgi:predicted nucleotidyltransferase